jgi:ribonuclease R
MKKRRKSYRSRTTPKKYKRDHTAHQAEKSLRNQVLATLYLSETDLGINDILKAIGLPRSLKDSVEQILSELCHEGSSFKSTKKGYSLEKKHRLFEATVEMNRSGFGFAIDLSRRNGGEVPSKDPYISATCLNSALHGDRVLLAISRIRRDGRSEGEVIRVLKRQTTTLAGFYTSDKINGFVSPEDPRFPFNIIVSKPPEKPIKDGDGVIIRLFENNRQNSLPSGEIIEVLGNPQQYGVQIRLVIEKFGLPTCFSKEAEQQAGNAHPEPAPDQREDLREIKHVTIDGKDARDFDDAIAVEKLKNGYRLYVSIADVSAFVRAGSTLDKEAYERGTSVYLPGTVIPMLPEHLSNNLCSLLPDTDRLTVTAILDFDQLGNVKKTRFTRSVIRSRKRFTYATVEQIMVSKDPAVRDLHKPFLKPLMWAGELALALQKKREARGSIGFTLPEAEITFGEDHQVLSITKASRTFSHQLIEEFMLAANEAVAQAFAGQGLDLLYRIHEEPSPEKITDFVKFSATLGLDVPKNPGTPEWYNQLISLVKETDREYIVNSLLLRSMQQARYSPVNCGHFGLATDLYCHFTSPIRRYPDLIVHRLLCQLIEAQSTGLNKPGKTKFSPQSSLKDAGIHLSARERTSIASERDMSDRLKRQYMAERIGESFNAIISGVTNNVFFVELLDCFVSGSVALSTLTDDYYILDEKNHRFVGDISGRVLQIGNVVDVVLVDIDRHRNRMFFTLGQTS